MPFAKHVGQPPAFDATAFARTAGAADRASRDFVDWKQFVEGASEFDGSGLRDVVEANADALDDLKGDFDAHRTNDNQRHQTINARLAALEAQPGIPFPGSG